MLASEVYANILRNLSRDDLDNVQQIDFRSYKIATSQSFTKEGPLRLLHKLEVRSEGNYAIRLTRYSNVVELEDTDDLKARLKFAVVEQLEKAWKSASSIMPKFESPEVRVRALDGLLFCHEMHIRSSDFRLVGSLMSRACVQHCQRLCIVHDDTTHVDTNALASWIHRGGARSISFFARLPNADLHFSLHALIEVLKELFEKATEPRPYVVEIRSSGAAPVVQKEVHRNKKTSERLEINHILGGQMCRVKVKRVPDDKE